MKKIISYSEKDTIKLGQQWGASCRGGEVFALVGDLGVGKTKIAKGIAKGLGIKTVITSPTFNIFRVYRINKNKVVKKFYHIDAYRLKSPKDIINLGVQEFLGKKDVVVIIEWAEKIKNILPLGTTIIYLKSLGEKQREIIVK